MTLKTDIEIIQIEVICDEALHCRRRDSTELKHRLQGGFSVMPIPAKTIYPRTGDRQTV